MTIEAIEALAAAEETVRKMQAEAAANAKQSLSQAREEGERLIAAALATAENELSEFGKNADEKAKAEVVAMAANNENRKAAMRAHAEARADKAAAFIVERIVNS